MHDARNLRFYSKAKLITILGFIAVLSQLGFWDPSRHVFLNVISIFSGMATIGLVFFAFYKRVNVAKYALYVLTLFSILSFVLYVQLDTFAKVSVALTAAVLIFSLILLAIFRAEAKDYFSTEGTGTWLKVLYGIVFLLVSGTTVAGLMMQLKLKAESEKEAIALKDTLVMEGAADPTAVATCKEKYASSTKGLNDEQLNVFCTCVALNLENIVKNVKPEGASGFTQLLSKYMAIGDACMAKIKK